MADLSGVLLGAVALGGILWISGALCQSDIMNGALCPPGQGVWATGGGSQHWATRDAPGHSGRVRRGTIDTGYGDGYCGDNNEYCGGGSGDYSAYMAHVSIA